MIDLLKKYFQKSAADDEPRPSSAQDIAVCALFLEMAYVDGEFSEDEQRNVLRMLQERKGVTAEEAREIMAIAASEREERVDVWCFTTLIRNHFEKTDTIDIVERLWDLVLADGHIHQHEDYLMNKLGDLIGLTHPEIMSAKIKALEKRGRLDPNSL